MKLHTNYVYNYYKRSIPPPLQCIWPHFQNRPSNFQNRDRNSKIDVGIFKIEVKFECPFRITVDFEFWSRVIVHLTAAFSVGLRLIIAFVGGTVRLPAAAPIRVFWVIFGFTFFGWNETTETKTNIIVNSAYIFRIFPQSQIPGLVVSSSRKGPKTRNSGCPSLQ